MTRPIRILIADDHPLVRAGLRSTLAAEPAFEVIAEAADGQTAVALATTLTPDLVVMDLRMPVLDGASAATALRTACPSARVVVLTSYETDADIVRAVDVGAIGYLLKDMQGPALLLALRDAAAGRTVLAPSVAMRLAARASTRAAQLTPREISILGLVRKGRANRQIGRELRIGEATVKTHLLHIFEKLGVHDRTSAVVTALERGVLRMEDG